MSRFSVELLERARAYVLGERLAPPAPDAPPAAPPAGDEAGSFTELAIATTVALCRRFEGFYPQPYLCPAGVPTIGYGATHYADGRRVKLTDPALSHDAALRLLFLQVKREYLPAVLKLCPTIDTPDRLAAIVDFTFNLGAGNLAASTLRKRINAGDWDDVPDQLRRWNRGGGKVLRGLVLRREAEAALI